ncbi:MAG: hypothetical protein L6V93_05940 [Clostridiales bacterium]|nr:MAG: hypothetical protein L6V93_05940 [Clostridiales bacterium]
MAKTESDKWYINSSGGDYDIFVFAGGMSDIIKRYTAITGRNKMPKNILWDTGAAVLCLTKRTPF